MGRKPIVHEGCAGIVSGQGKLKELAAAKKKLLNK
jgi:hypothetical protein